MIPTLAQVCSLHSPFEKDVEDYAAGQCRSLELWLGKLEGYLEKHSVDDVRRLLGEHEMQAPVASFQGGLLASQGEFRREHWTSFANRLALCRQLGVQTLVIVGDLTGQLNQTDFERVRHSRCARRPSGRARPACGWRWSFKPGRSSATTCKPPRRWSAKPPIRRWASASTCFTITWARASSKTWAI